METQTPVTSTSSPEDTKVKGKYRVNNWPEYDKALVQRGNVTVWFDEEFVRGNWKPDPTGKRGMPRKYSDMAIQVLLTLKVTFHLTYRCLEGFGRSLMKLMGLNFEIPDHTLMSRRAKGLQVNIPRKQRTEPIHIAVDSTGLKVYGEGEWKVRKHGTSKRRSWIKLHLAVDVNEKDIVAVEVTTEEWGDNEVFAGLIDQIESPIGKITADGAYDTHEAYEVAQAHEAELAVPPRESAVAWEADHPRSVALEQIEKQGMQAWKEQKGYHERSIAENAMFRVKQLFGDRLASRIFETRVVECHARIAAMNIMTYLGMPVSVRVGTTFA